MLKQRQLAVTSGVRQIMYHLQCMCMSMASPFVATGMAWALAITACPAGAAILDIDLTCGHICQVADQAHLLAPQCMLALFVFVASQGSVTTTCKREGPLKPPSSSPKSQVSFSC